MTSFIFYLDTLYKEFVTDVENPQNVAASIFWTAHLQAFLLFDMFVMFVT